MKTNKDKTTPRSIRLDQDQIDKAQSMGLNLTALFQAALSSAVNEKICPCCGTKIKKKALK